MPSFTAFPISAFQSNSEDDTWECPAYPVTEYYPAETRWPRIGPSSSGLAPTPARSVWFPKATPEKTDTVKVPSSTANDASKPAVGLIDIPTEVRNIIWHYALDGEQHVPMYALNASTYSFDYFKDNVPIRRYRSHEYQEHPPFLPGICRLSNKLRLETIHVFLLGTTFISSSINDNNAITSFLGSVPGALACVRGLHFDYFSRMRGPVPANRDLELAVSCTGLREFRITVHSFEMGRQTAEEAWRYYMLARLLDCGSLEKVVIKPAGWFEGNGSETMRDLAMMIKHGFATRKQEVVVEVVGACCSACQMFLTSDRTFRCANNPETPS